MSFDERIGRILDGAPHLSMVPADPGCRAINSDHVRQQLSDADVAEIMEQLAAHGGRVERKAPLERRGLRPGIRGRRLEQRAPIWHVPLTLLDGREPG